MSKKIYKARQVIAESFRNDPDFRDTYKANIAMYLWDRKREGIRFNSLQCNEVADGLIKLLFES